MRLRLPIVAALVLSACEPEPPTPDAGGLMLQELRALRQTLAEPGRPAVDKSALVEALEPLREALRSLAQDQQDLRTRQTALTEELQRWTTMVARTPTAAPEEVQQLQARLAEIEASLKSQDARHREVEALLQKALESTADRLDQFLRRLDSVRTEGSKPEQATGAPAKGGAETPPGGSASPSGGGGMALGPGANGASSRAPRPLGPAFVALLGGGALVMMVMLWRLFRAPAAVAEADAAPAQARDADELWAAAAMLGEAVDMLKQQRAPLAGGTADSLAAVLSSLRAHAAMPVADDVEDESALDVARAGEPAAVAAAADPPPVFAVRPVAQPRVDPVAPREPVAPAGAAQNGPPRHSRSFGPADPQAFAAAAQALLANEPRVLRRPAPRIERGQESASSVLVEFALLPGHDEALGQRLLDALQQLARTL